jgi:hypothetical protein
VENDTSDAAVDASTAAQQITQLPQPKPTSDDTPGPNLPFEHGIDLANAALRSGHWCKAQHFLGTDGRSSPKGDIGHC